MEILIREYTHDDAASAAKIWNEVVLGGIAFPQMEILNDIEADDFFSSQSFTGIAFNKENNEAVGLYILHPNNVGRCGHICNASYAVGSDFRGYHIGEKLVLHCLKTAKDIGFKILQINAVVSTNTHALRLYKKLGFTPLGTIPNGFLCKDGHYEDIIPHYITL